jgi:hypothetical protein
LFAFLRKPFLLSARVLAAFFLILLPPPPAVSQDVSLPDLPETTVLVLPLPLGGEADRSFRGVLVAAMELQLEQAGLRPLRLAAAAEEALAARYGSRGRIDFDAEGAGLFETSLRAGADFLLVGGYIREKEGITINFYLADVEAGTLLASVAKQAMIDFSLDRVMIQALEEMRPFVEQPIARVVRRKAEAAARRPGEQEAGRGASEEVNAQTETAQPEAVLPDRIPGAGPPESAEVARFRPHEFSIGFAPFIPLGWSGETFNLSYAPFAYWNYRRSTARGVLGVGAFAAVNLFEPRVAGLASYLHTLITAGADFRYTGPEHRRPNLFVRLSAGGAVNVSDFSKLPEPENLSRFMAFGAGGGGAMLALSPSVGLAVDVTCEVFVYFWQEEKGGDIRTQWILGISPALYIYTRL